MRAGHTPHSVVRLTRVALGLGLWASCALAAPISARAQTPSANAPAAAESPAPEDPHQPRDSRLYLGMWTMHLKDPVLALRNNWAVGFTTHGYFGATFINSYGNRAFAGGWQRTIAQTAPRAVRAALGIRLGVITGYDGRLMRLARDTPVLPLVQPFARIDLSRVGVEVSYTWVVVSVGLSYRIGAGRQPAK